MPLETNDQVTPPSSSPSTASGSVGEDSAESATAVVGASHTNGAASRLRSGLPARELEDRLVSAARRTDVGLRELAFYLADMDARGVHQLLGYASALQFAAERLEIGRRKAYELIAAGKALEDLPKIDAAFFEGRLRWARVRLLARVARPAVEDAWLRAALSLSWRDFERSVATTEPGRAPKENEFGLPEVKIAVRARVSAVDYERIELARRKLADERGADVDESEFLTLAADLILGSRADGVAVAREPVDDSVYRIALTRCRDCRTTSLQASEGPVPITSSSADRINCDAEVHEEDAGSENRHGPGTYAPKTTPRLRRFVLTRDGRKCRSCRSPRSLNVHHVVWRSSGGATTATNLLTLCARCHALVHDRLLIIDGETADEVVFRDREGRSLATESVAPPVTDDDLVASEPVEGATRDDPAPGRIVFNDVPDSVEASWFARHAHLFRWNDKRNELTFTPGFASEASAPRRPVASPDAGESSNESVDALSDRRDPTRPNRLAELVGQVDVKNLLLPAIEAARIRGRPLDHALFFGPPGTGKSTFARLVAAEFGSRAKIVNGPSLIDPGLVLRLLASLEQGDVLFVDEVHASPRRLIEALYEAMEEGRASFAIGDGVRVKTLSVVLAPFTLIAATTEAGILPEAFESRFGLRASFAPFSTEELAKVVKDAASRADGSIVDDAARLLASAARGSAREALTLVRRAFDFAAIGADRSAAGPKAASGPTRIDVPAAEAALRALTIDEDGLRAVERRALFALRRGGMGRPMGLLRWSAASRLPVATLRRVCEPALLRGGFMEIGPRGRFALPLRRSGRPGARYGFKNTARGQAS